MCTAIAPTALPRDHAVERLHIEPTWRYPKRTRPDDTPEQRDPPLPRNRSPPFFHLRGRCNHQMGARTSTTHCARGIGIDVLFASCRIHQSRIAYVNTPAPPLLAPRRGKSHLFSLLFLLLVRVPCSRSRSCLYERRHNGNPPYASPWCGYSLRWQLDGSNDHGDQP